MKQNKVEENNKEDKRVGKKEIDMPLKLFLCGQSTLKRLGVGVP